MNAWGDNYWLVPHAEYVSLGKTTEERCYAYRELFKVQLSEENLHLIRHSAHSHYSQPIGDDRFREQIEKRYGITLGQTKRGRPKKVASELAN